MNTTHLTLLSQLAILAITVYLIFFKKKKKRTYVRKQPEIKQAARPAQIQLTPKPAVKSQKPKAKKGKMVQKRFESLVKFSDDNMTNEEKAFFCLRILNSATTIEILAQFDRITNGKYDLEQRKTIIQPALSQLLAKEIIGAEKTIRVAGQKGSVPNRYFIKSK